MRAVFRVKERFGGGGGGLGWDVLHCEVSCQVRGLGLRVYKDPTRCKRSPRRECTVKM